MKINVVVALVAAMMLAETALGQSDAVRIQPRQSIFSRDGRAGTPARPGTGTRGVDSAPVFIGVIKDDDAFIGLLLVSNGRGGADVISVRAGDTIAWDQSRVSQVSWELLYLQGGTQSTDKVQLGHDLENISKIPAPGPFYRTQDDLNASGQAPGNVPPGNPPQGPQGPRNNSFRIGTRPGVNPGVNRTGIRGRSGYNGLNLAAPAAPGGA